jgi:hypothetical protein
MQFHGILLFLNPKELVQVVFLRAVLGLHLFQGFAQSQLFP